MAEGRLKTTNIVEKSAAGCFDTIDLVSSLYPLKSGDMPKLCDKLVVKNAGGAERHLVCYIFEANSDRKDITALWAKATSHSVKPDETFDFGSVTAANGLDNDYPPGSKLYLCFKVWAIQVEKTWPNCPPKPCSIPTAAVKIPWA